MSRKPRQLWPRVVSEANGALEGQTLVSQAKQSAAAVQGLLKAYTAAERSRRRACKMRPSSS